MNPTANRPSVANARAVKPLPKKHLKNSRSAATPARKKSWARKMAESPDAPAAVRNAMPLDWHALLEGPPPPEDWLLWPMVQRGQVVSLYSRPKAGKSLLILDLLRRVLSGQQLDGSSTEPAIMIYLDMENGEKDLRKRLDDLGASPEELDHLVYLSFPDIGPLNTKTGSGKLLENVDFYGADLVVIDTITRFVEGSENDSATWLELYNLTLGPLKRRNVASLRLDHTGRDEERGARGSSAKSGDIDSAWSLTYKAQNMTRTLKRQESRDGAGPETLTLRVESQPLRHLLEDDAEDPVQQMIQTLDELGLPPGDGRTKARALLKRHSRQVSNDVLNKAVNVRKSKLNEPVRLPNQAPTV